MKSPFTTKTKGLPRFGIIVAIAAGLIGILYGYDSGTFSAVLPFWEDDFALEPWMSGLLGSATIFGITIGVMIGGRICDAIGRQKMMLIVVLGFAVTSLLGAIPISAWWLLGVRLVLGFFIGFSQIAGPLFIGEFAPDKIRGALLVSYQVAQSIGHIIATYTAFFFVSSGTWEIVVGIAALPGIILALIIARFPDTPRWYILKGHREKAYETMGRIEEADKVQEKIDEVDMELEKSLNIGKGRVKELFQKRFSKRLIFVIGFGFFAHITGMTAINYYGPIIFQSVGFNLSNSLLLTGLVQVFALVAELIAFIVVDKWGRRPTLLTGIASMAVSLALLSILYFVGFEGVGGVLAVACILIFRMGFGIGFGSLVWIYASETFPLRLRGTGASVLLTVNNLGSLMVAQVFPIALSYIGGGFTFATFGVLAVFAWFFIFILAPETKGRTLEEIDTYWGNGGHWPKGSGGKKVI